MIESREFVEKAIRRKDSPLAPVSEAEIKQLVDAVMLRQQAKDAAEKYVGHHEYVCGNGEKVSYYVDGWLAGWQACEEFMNGSIKAAELVATNTRLDYESLKASIEQEAEHRRAVLESMEKQRDPRLDPQVGDKIYRITPSTGLRRSRQVVARVNNDITYLTHDGKQRTCWISTWQEWANHAEVEA